MNRAREVEAKVERVRGWLREQGRPGILLRRRASFAWLTAGGRSHVSTSNDVGAAAILVTPERVALPASNIEARRLAEEELAGVTLEVAEYPGHEPDGERERIVERS